MSKTTADPTSHLSYVLSVLSHCEDVRFNWESVAQEHGIGYARNATSKFKDIVKKYGYKFEANRLCKIGDEEDERTGGHVGGADGATVVPKTPTKKPREKKNVGPASVKSSGKKRKLDVENDEDDQA